MDAGEEAEDTVAPVDEDDDINSNTCDLNAWEHHETVCRELMDCFETQILIHYNTGCSWPLAFARQCPHFIGFARNEARLQHINMTLIACVVAQMIEGKQDGFSVRRGGQQRTPAGGPFHLLRPPASHRRPPSSRR